MYHQTNMFTAKYDHIITVIYTPTYVLHHASDSANSLCAVHKPNTPCYSICNFISVSYYLTCDYYKALACVFFYVLCNLHVH